MGKTEETQQQKQQQNMDKVPPPGYPTLTPPEGKMKNKKGWFRTKNRGEKGFIEGWYVFFSSPKLIIPTMSLY
ncbi:Protein IMPACT-B [Bienertia sinuspersici]